MEDQLNEQDVKMFEDYVTEFFQICQKSIAKETPTEYKDQIENYVVGGKTKPIELSDGTKVTRHFAFGKNELLKTPYVNIGWVNLYFDWGGTIFGEPRVFIASPRVENFKTLTHDKFTTNTNFEVPIKLVGQEIRAYSAKYKVNQVDDSEININESNYPDILKNMKYFDQKLYNQKLSSQLLRDKNIILHGAPGTGKTYTAQTIASNILGVPREALMASKQYGFVQFHPSYDYTDFVEGLRPAGLEGGQLQFSLQPGIFMTFCNLAKADTQKPYIFVIDEINRGDLSKIFGELFFAIDPGYRGKASAVTTQYANLHRKSDEAFYIPENVYIIGTMNDIDRSAETIDFAMRRRFRFIRINAVDSVKMLNVIQDQKVRRKITNKLNRLNDAIRKDDVLSQDYEIGPGYCMRLTDPEVSIDDVWQEDIEPLLTEYLQGLDDFEDRLSKFKKVFDSTK
ncbi:endonuclease [Secundilactobacillus odoratitofui DSM 19909 = JCM 15043]|uniref:Endonuclease n=1 Tax=Secundilactobacillus odoratitofui DSM 19909 = JCM 15043 TaxID=1423776 RepID=A0A0R1LMM7_9LACO|nr:AAA family ATPase [Secundilactobacillus odoratitofui]KRK97158.1 endonuclease [Secundilactobacillus odoratitofui DSM 19909 = JCM 15043]